MNAIVTFFIKFVMRLHGLPRMTLDLYRQNYRIDVLLSSGTSRICWKKWVELVVVAMIWSDHPASTTRNLSFVFNCVMGDDSLKNLAGVCWHFSPMLTFTYICWHLLTICWLPSAPCWHPSATCWLLTNLLTRCPLGIENSSYSTPPNSVYKHSSTVYCRQVDAYHCGIDCASMVLLIYTADRQYKHVLKMNNNM